jgi:hypothetical protein
MYEGGRRADLPYPTDRAGSKWVMRAERKVNQSPFNKLIDIIEKFIINENRVFCGK